jgi:hypothetical protein
MIRRTLFATVLLVGLSAAAHAQRPDFSGDWQLDRDASTITTAWGLAGFSDFAPPRLHISQASDETLILSTRERGTETRAYEFDAETWVPAPGDDGARMLVRSRVRGASLVIEGHAMVDGEMIGIREVLSINRSGDTLTLQVTTTVAGQAETNTLVYKRARR